jgi:hypothetical protein
MANIEIFVSHGSDDAALASALVDVIREAVAVDDQAIRCTSVAGYKLGAGAKISEQLREELVGARAVLGIVTKSSIKSSYVLFELGAAWGAQVETFPLLARGATAADLPGPLKERNARNLADATEISQLITDLELIAGYAPRSSNSARQTRLNEALRAAAALP